MTQKYIGNYNQYQQRQKINGLISRIALEKRRQMFDKVMNILAPGPDTRVVDVGVTNDRREDSNFFEKLYPHPQNITAVGLEDCVFLEQDFPGLKFIRADGAKLPFEDQVFDLAVSFATVEHVGNRQRQQDFVREMCRVGKICCIATPNRWYPIEFHTVLPIAHWLPKHCFYPICKAMGYDFYACEENLNLLSKGDLMSLFPEGQKVRIEKIKLFGLPSNFIAHNKSPELLR